MLPLFDMLANAENGKAIDLLSRQFNLSRQQTELALEALLPAFSQGLKRNVSDPYGIAAFMNALASGNQAKYFEDASRAFSPDGIANGNDILSLWFGSKDLSRAVAAQAAQATGIGQDILKQMLPVIASMIMGGMFKQSTSQLQGGQMPAGGFGASNPLGEIIEQMMRQGGGMMPKQQPQPQSAPDPFDNPFGKVLKDMFGGGAATQDQPQPRQMPGGMDNPFGKILEEMLGGSSRAAPAPEPEPEPAPRQRANPSGRQRNPYDDIFGDMFETGRKTRDEYQKGVENIFEQFTRGYGQVQVARGQIDQLSRPSSCVSQRPSSRKPNARPSAGSPRPCRRACRPYAQRRWYPSCRGRSPICCRRRTPC